MGWHFFAIIMRIDLRNLQRELIGRLDLSPDDRPTKTRLTDSKREVILNWDSAVDDGGQLRRCISCGCQDLFREKSFPAAAGIIIVLAFIGGVVGVLGLATSTLAQIGMILMLTIDIALLVFSRTRLVCYRCRTSYYDLPIASYHRRWDRSVARNHPAPALMPADSPVPVPSASSEQQKLEV